MADRPQDPDPLIARLQRATDALAKEGGPPPPPAVPASPATPESSGARGAGGAGMILAMALLATAIASGRSWIFIPAVLLAIFSGLALLSSLGETALDPTRSLVGLGASVGKGAQLEPGSRIGAGASVGKDVHLEPGATIGMGASVGKGAVLRRDAKVQAGATLSAGAVLEAGAVVAWGADVGRDAVIGEGARIGAGASVGRGAYVPAGTHVRAGSTWNNTDRSAARAIPAQAQVQAHIQAHVQAEVQAQVQAQLQAQAGARTQGAAPVPAAEPAPARVAAPPTDPRAAKIDAGCAKLESELRQAPPAAREYLGTSQETVRSFREMCHGLLRRELALRAETSPEAMAQLQEERAALEKRLAGVTDEHVRRSLASAVAAIDEQQRHRAIMARTADRLEAELTRLLWTMDGMAAQMVRLRTAGEEIGSPKSSEAVRGVKRLQDEIGAIADALEELAETQRAELIPVSDIGEAGASVPSIAQRERE